MLLEDQARAETYGLIASVLAAPPDRDFLKLHAPPEAGPDENGKLPLTLQQLELSPRDAALERLTLACAAYDEAVIAEEYDELFRRQAAALATNATPSGPQLATLRAYLVGMGLPAIRSDGEVTRYVAAACEVMRWLLEHEKPIELQMQFFYEFVYTGIGAICGAVEENPRAGFYAAVAELARTFIANERAAFTSERAT